jgi:hypothetical protein
MQSWTEVRLQMLAWGFSRVLTIEIVHDAAYIGLNCGMN